MGVTNFFSYCKWFIWSREEEISVGSTIDGEAWQPLHQKCASNRQVTRHPSDPQPRVQKEFKTKPKWWTKAGVISRNFWAFARKLRESLTDRWDSYWDSHSRLGEFSGQNGEFNQLTSLTWLHRLSFSQKQDSGKIWTNLKYAKKEKL